AGRCPIVDGCRGRTLPAQQDRRHDSQAHGYRYSTPIEAAVNGVLLFDRPYPAALVSENRRTITFNTEHAVGSSQGDSDERVKEARDQSSWFSERGGRWRRRSGCKDSGSQSPAVSD